MFPEAALTTLDTHDSDEDDNGNSNSNQNNNSYNYKIPWTGVTINVQAREQGCRTNAGEVLASSLTTMHAFALGNRASSW